MTIVLTVLSALLLAAVPVAYYLGRRSSVEEAVDRRLERELRRTPLVNPQKAADQGEAGNG